MYFNKVVVINNAAKEPEIVDLCNFIIKMGVTIDGIGTETLIVKGIKKISAQDISFKIISGEVRFSRAVSITLKTRYFSTGFFDCNPYFTKSSKKNSKGEVVKRLKSAEWRAFESGRCLSRSLMNKAGIRVFACTAKG